jgi:hypothetical protein
MKNNESSYVHDCYCCTNQIGPLQLTRITVQDTIATFGVATQNRFSHSATYLKEDGPVSWSSGQSFWLLIMRSRFRFSVLPWGFFLEGEDSHGLGSSVKLWFKTPPYTSYSYFTIHLIGTTKLRLMGVTTSEVGYTSATIGWGDHEVYKGHVVAL